MPTSSQKQPSVNPPQGILARVLLSFACLCLSLTGSAAANLDSVIQADNRLKYARAVELLTAGQTSNGQFRELREALSDYPLASYLDYQALSRDASALSPKAIAAHFTAIEDQGYAIRLHKQRLEHLAKTKRWQHFLSHYNGLTPGQTARLQSQKMSCLRATALYRTGSKQQAYASAVELWQTPSSLPKACDAVFHVIQSQGLITEAMARERFLEAFAHNRYRLAKYLKRFLTEEDATTAQRLIAIYQNPAPLQSKWPSLSAQVIAMVNRSDKERRSANSSTASRVIYTLTKRLARKNTDRATRFIAEVNPFSSGAYYSDTLQQKIRDYIIQRVALKDYSNLESTYKKLGSPQTDKSLEWLLRAHIANAEWSKVKLLTDTAPPRLLEHSRWQYWSLRSRQLERSLTDEQLNTFQELASGANFYAFSAAYWLNTPKKIAPITHENPKHFGPQLLESHNIQRAIEHFVHGETLEANRNWNKALQQLDAEHHLSAAYLAASIGWDEKAIHSAARAKAWQHYNVRFPQRYSEAFEQAASRYVLPPHWFYATARQESALAPKARSHAGAVGLMQLLPSTANQVARSLGVDFNRSLLLDPEYSIKLGSAYLYDLHQRYGNRIVSSAAYNAGTRRVDTWLKAQNTELPVDAWIETIRYSETRQYVQNVLSFGAINYLLHHKADPPAAANAWQTFDFYASHETTVRPFEQQILATNK